MIPFRSVGVSCGAGRTGISHRHRPRKARADGPAGGPVPAPEKAAADRSVDNIRQRFGHQAIQRGVILADRHYAVIKPEGAHHPSRAVLRGVNRAAE